MDTEKKQLFIMISTIFATLGKLNLTNEQLRHLYKECIEMARSLGDIATLLTASNALADVSFKLSQFNEAMTHYEIFANFTRHIGDRAAEADTCGKLGKCNFSVGQYDKAIYYHEMQLKIAGEISDKKGEADAFSNLGISYCSLGQYEKAIQYLQMNQNILKQIGDQKSEASSFCNLGICYYSLGQYSKAIDHHERSLKIARHIGDGEIVGFVNGNLSNCYQSLGQYDKAIVNLEVCLELAKQTGNRAFEGTCCGNLGNCFCLLGQYGKALHYHEIDLNIAKQTQNKASEGRAYGNLGGCYHFLGQYDMAIRHFEMSLDIAKLIGDKAGEGIAYSNLGNCFFSLNQKDIALRYYKMYLNIAKQIQDKAGEGNAHGKLGDCYFTFGQDDIALTHYEMCLNIAKHLGDKEGEGDAYGKLGHYYQGLGQLEKAKHNYEMQLNIAQQIGNKVDEGRAFRGLGKHYIFRGQPDKAIYYCEKYLSIAKQTKGKEDMATAYFNLGLCHFFLEQNSGAEINLRCSVHYFEELFESAPEQDKLKTSIRDTFIHIYIILTATLVLQEKLEEALITAERGRARALTELMLTSYSVQCTEVSKSIDLDLREVHEVVKTIGCTVMFLTLDISGIQWWILQPTGGMEFRKTDTMVPIPIKTITSRMDFVSPLSEKLKLLVDQACKSRDIVNCEDRSLSFLYSEDDSEATDSALLSGLSSVTLSDEVFLESEVSSDAVDHKEGTMRRNPLKEMYQIVLGPVLQLVQGSKLVVVPDGILSLVPFAALMDEDGRYAAEYLQVRLVPSLTTAKIITENQVEASSQGNPLIVGDPDAGPRSRLPYAKKEAQLVGKLFDTQPLTGKEATKQTFLRYCENANLIHIAAHGNMERGEILLAPDPVIKSRKPKKEDKVLKMSDLENKRLRAKLVVLSCCHSARGEIKAEGIIGIARAFLGAGARSVLVALWAIEDEATFYFMKKFYEHLIGGEKAGESLNRTMATMRNTAEYSDPQHWAPFVLIGDDVTVCQ